MPGNPTYVGFFCIKNTEISMSKITDVIKNGLNTRHFKAQYDTPIDKTLVRVNLLAPDVTFAVRLTPISEESIEVFNELCGEQPHHLLVKCTISLQNDVIISPRRKLSDLMGSVTMRCDKIVPAHSALYGNALFSGIQMNGKKGIYQTENNVKQFSEAIFKNLKEVCNSKIRSEKLRIILEKLRDNGHIAQQVLFQGDTIKFTTGGEDNLKFTLRDYPDKTMLSIDIPHLNNSAEKVSEAIKLLAP